MWTADDNHSRDTRPDGAQHELRPSGVEPSGQDTAGGEFGAAGRNSVLDRAFQMLDKVASGERPLNLTEMSRAAKLPLPTTYRLAKALVRLGALEKDAGRYTLGPVWWQWCETAGQHSESSPN
ncbi:helix-turn-helix domain-containing protein [Saccharothrix sp. Mg75]|uniref:helix-turn-helix domain-containing protein n=1 Tax=Saccharothrix sp. Mg75 TaxID=3445357 RepID=UPI003EED38F1